MKNFRVVIASLILLAAFAFKPDTSSASGIQVSYTNAFASTLRVTASYDLYARIGSSAVFVSSGLATRDISSGSTADFVTGTDNIDLYQLTGLSITILGRVYPLTASQISILNSGSSTPITINGQIYTITPQIVSFGGTSVFNISN